MILYLLKAFLSFGIENYRTFASKVFIKIHLLDSSLHTGTIRSKNEAAYIILCLSLRAPGDRVNFCTFRSASSIVSSF